MQNLQCVHCITPVGRTKQFTSQYEVLLSISLHKGVYDLFYQAFVRRICAPYLCVVRVSGS
jgi:hypothetical protein